jgi:hypothetical protein
MDLITWENQDVSSHPDELNDVYFPLECYRNYDCPRLAEESALSIQ